MGDGWVGREFQAGKTPHRQALRLKELYMFKGMRSTHWGWGDKKKPPTRVLSRESIGAGEQDIFILFVFI